MRKRILASFVLGCLTLTGCSDDDKPGEVESSVSMAYCNPELNPTCEGVQLAFTVQGKATANCLVYAALELRGRRIGRSSARAVSVGNFDGRSLGIELSGRHLEPGTEYDLVLHQVDDSNAVDKGGSIVMSPPVKHTFTTAEVEYIASFDSVPDPPRFAAGTQGATYCFVTGNPVVLKFVRDANGTWYISPNTCGTAVDTSMKSLIWSVGGSANPQSGVISKYGVFLPLHKTRLTNSCLIRVEDTLNSGRRDSIWVVIEYPTDVHLKIGDDNNWIDTLICEFADSIGFTPQLLKSQVRQESGDFDTTAYRYEPRFDWRRVSYLDRKVDTVWPFRWYRIACPSENGYSQSNDGDSLEAVDRDYARQFYYVWDVNANNYLSAWEYINTQGTSCYWHCAGSTYCPSDDSVGQCPPSYVDFTAQTAISSSYGLLQLMWTSTFFDGGIIAWNNNRAGDPHLLFNPELSIRFGARMDRYWFVQFWDGSFNNYEQAVDSALLIYNGGGNTSYPSNVRNHLSTYSIRK